MPDEQVGDGGGLLDGGEVRGARHQGEPGVGDAGDEGAGLGGAGDPVLGADEDQRGHADPGEVGTDVERGEGLAGGDVAARVGGADHLDGPVRDRRLGGGEARGEPPLGRAGGEGFEAARADGDRALAVLVGGAEAG